MSVTAMLDAVQNDYNNAKSKADAALDSLKVRADAGMSSSYDSVWQEITDSYPIDKIAGIDDIMSTIEALADEIGKIQYNPPAEVPDFQMEDHKIWEQQDGSFSNQLETAMKQYLLDYGIPEIGFQNAIFNESHERNLQTLNDMYDLADAKTGAKGFTYPNSMTTALKLDAQQKYQFDRNQVNRDVTKLVTEWARQNYQFAIEKGISFEQFHADFTYKYCTAFVDIYKNFVLASIERFKAELGKYVEPIRALVEAAKLPVEVGKVNADIQKANIDAFVESNKSKIQEALGAYGNNVQVLINGFKTQIDAWDSIAKQTASMIQAAARSVIGIQK